jgi:hypothetical protein
MKSWRERGDSVGRRDYGLWILDYGFWMMRRVEELDVNCYLLLGLLG